MIFLSLIVVLAIVNFTSVAAVLHRDTWFILLSNKLRRLPAISATAVLPLILALVIPLLLLVLCILAVLYYGSPLFLFFIYVPVLLYSVGRGDLVAGINNYLAAAARGDTVAASQWVADAYSAQGLAWDGAAVSSWRELHTQALRIIAYRSFEHTFAVLFWFVIAGPLGALLYRLSVIYRAQTLTDPAAAIVADKWLWLLELPAVRLMGLIWAFVGNFDSRIWNESLLDTHSSSLAILNKSLRGALSAPADVYMASEPGVADPAAAAPSPDTEVVLIARNDEAEEVIEDLVGVTLGPQSEPAYSFALVKSSVPLYGRALLFCVGVIAFATLFL